MSSDSAQERKRRLKKAFKAETRTELASCPLPLDDLRRLIDTVSRLLFDEGGVSLCDHTHRLTRSCLAPRGSHEIDRVLCFQRSKGGDCEVAMNLSSWLAWNAPSGETRH